jgi:hypothetical protein
MYSGCQGSTEPPKLKYPVSSKAWDRAISGRIPSRSASSQYRSMISPMLQPMPVALLLNAISWAACFLVAWALPLMVMSL